MTNSGMPRSPKNRVREGPRIPSALDHIDRILDISDRRLAVFLDYDGTLTPIVERPELAVLYSSMREAIQTLTRYATVAILSGRDLDDISQRVGIDNIIFAGSHGFDVVGPDGLRKQVATEFLTILDAAAEQLREKLSDVPGALVEKKRFSIAAHYRLTDERGADAVAQGVTEVASQHRGLRIVSGKKVYELQPDVDWNKGRALLWLMETLGLDESNILLVYIGDDRTDEDAFRALDESGIGIIVTEQPRPTAAHFALRNPAEVESFLRKIASFASSRRGDPQKRNF